MDCSELGKHSREDYNRLVFNFIVEREGISGINNQNENLNQKLI